MAKERVGVIVLHDTGLIADQHIIACAGIELVVAQPAYQYIGAIVAFQLIVGIVACAVQVGRAGQQQIVFPVPRV